MLVIPERCVHSLTELQPDEVTDLFGVVRRVQKVLRIVHGIDTTSIGIQTGKEAGQTVKVIVYFESSCSVCTQQITMMKGNMER